MLHASAARSLTLSLRAVLGDDSLRLELLEKKFAAGDGSPKAGDGGGAAGLSGFMSSAVSGASTFVKQAPPGQPPVAIGLQYGNAVGLIILVKAILRWAASPVAPAGAYRRPTPLSSLLLLE